MEDKTEGLASGRISTITNKPLRNLWLLVKVNAILSCDALQLICEPSLEAVPIMLVNPLAIYEIIPTNEILLNSCYCTTAKEERISQVNPKSNTFKLDRRARAYKICMTQI